MRAVVERMVRTVTLREVRDILGADVLWAGDLSAQVDSVGAADLMSDVLALSRPGMLLLTGLATLQCVRTAAVSDLRAVVLVRGKKPDGEMVALASEEGIPIMSTPLTMFEASGVLYQAMARP